MTLDEFKTRIRFDRTSLSLMLDEARRQMDHGDTFGARRAEVLDAELDFMDYVIKMADKIVEAPKTKMREFL